MKTLILLSILALCACVKHTTVCVDPTTGKPARQGYVYCYEK